MTGIDIIEGLLHEFTIVLEQFALEEEPVAQRDSLTDVVDLRAEERGLGGEGGVNR